MESVGQQLRQARTARGVSLEQVSAKTRLSVKNLQAIEDDDLSKISSPFFYKSYARQFAEFLSLDFSKIAEQVQKVAASMPEPLMPGQEDAPLPNAAPIALPRRRSFKWVRSLAGFTAMLVACSSLYAVWKASRGDVREAVVGFVSVFASSRNADQPPHPVAPVADVSARNALAAAASPSLRDQTNHTKAAASTAPREESASLSAPETEASLHIELSATEPTWLSMVADGKEIFSGTLERAETKVLEGRESASIRMGNAGGLNVVFNGKPIGIVGPKGQVRTVVFTKDNYQVVEPSSHVAMMHLDTALE